MIFRKSRISLKVLTGFLILLSLIFIVLEKTAIVSTDPYYETKVRAARKMKEGIELLSRAIREDDQDSIDSMNDPNQTGLIGIEYSQITTTLGSLVSKRTSTNPNFAALIIDLLLKGGVTAGDQVAIGASASFPALNLAAILAIESIGAEPVLISSLGSSSWGANRINWTWLDLERFFHQNEIIQHRSIAVSLGGGNDQGEGFWDDGLKLAYMALERDQVTYLKTANLMDSIQKRMALYMKYDPVLFVNIGGAHSNLGNCSHADQIPSGLIDQIIPCFDPERGLILRFLEEGIPVVNLLSIRDLAVKYGLPIDPIPLPESGYSKVYYYKKYVTLYVYISFLIILSYIIWGYFYERGRKR